MFSILGDRKAENRLSQLVICKTSFVKHILVYFPKEKIVKAKFFNLLKSYLFLFFISDGTGGGCFRSGAGKWTRP